MQRQNKSTNFCEMSSLSSGDTTPAYVKKSSRDVKKTTETRNQYKGRSDRGIAEARPWTIYVLWREGDDEEKIVVTLRNGVILRVQFPWPSIVPPRSSVVIADPCKSFYMVNAQFILRITKDDTVSVEVHPYEHVGRRRCAEARLFPNVIGDGAPAELRVGDTYWMCCLSDAAADGGFRHERSLSWMVRSAKAPTSKNSSTSDVTTQIKKFISDASFDETFDEETDTGCGGSVISNQVDVSSMSASSLGVRENPETCSHPGAIASKTKKKRVRKAKVNKKKEHDAREIVCQNDEPTNELPILGDKTSSRVEIDGKSNNIEEGTGKGTKNKGKRPEAGQGPKASGQPKSVKEDSLVMAVERTPEDKKRSEGCYKRSNLQDTDSAIGETMNSDTQSTEFTPKGKEKRSPAAKVANCVPTPPSSNSDGADRADSEASSMLDWTDSDEGRIEPSLLLRGRTDIHTSLSAVVERGKYKRRSLDATVFEAFDGKGNKTTLHKMESNPQGLMILRPLAAPQGRISTLLAKILYRGKHTYALISDVPHRLKDQESHGGDTSKDGK